MSQNAKSVRGWIPRLKKIGPAQGHPPYPVWVGGAPVALQGGGPVVAPPGGRATVGWPTMGVHGSGPQLPGHPTVTHPATPYGGVSGPTNGPVGPGPGGVGLPRGPVGQLQNGGVVVVVHGVAPLVGVVGGPPNGAPRGGGVTQLLHPWATGPGWHRWPTTA
jgi:hypothetical protein